MQMNITDFLVITKTSAMTQMTWIRENLLQRGHISRRRESTTMNSDNYYDPPDEDPHYVLEERERIEDEKAEERNES